MCFAALKECLFLEYSFIITITYSFNCCNIMASKRIAEIDTLTFPGAIEVRIIRKWKPYSQRHELSYLFVDTFGDAIEADADLNEESYFDSIISLQACYIITKYTPVPARTYMRVVPHRASIKIGRRTIFTTIPDRNIPTYYYNFATYDILKDRLPRGSPLTDYIGRVESASHVIHAATRTRLKVTIQDDRKYVIPVTLWEEKALAFDRDSALNQILALTSMVVTKYEEAFQLGSTNATTIAINPSIPDLPAIIERFKNIEKATSFRSSQYPDSINENRITIAELLMKDAHEHVRTRFTCLATITEIHAYRTWYYQSCSECTKSALREKDETGRFVWVCSSHDQIPAPTYRYCVNTTIGDKTGFAEVVFYNEAMTDILQISCFDMVVTHGFTDPKILPDVINAIRGTSWLLHLQLKKDSSICVSRVFQPTKPLPMTDVYTTTTSQPETPSAKQPKRPREQSPETSTSQKRTKQQHSG